MHPLVRGAAAAAVLTALGSFYRPASDPAPSAAPSAVGDVRGVDGLPAPCGSGTLPEGPVCLRIPGEHDTLLLEGRDRAPSRGEPVADRIPRRPERPADPAAYLYPVGEPGRPPHVLNSLDKPGVRLAVRPGERVVLLGLEHQVGPAEVIFAGELFGRTVVTAHRVDDGRRQRTYLLFHGGLNRTAPAVVPGARLEPGAELGFARADYDVSAGLIDVYLEAREVREGAKLDPADARRLVDPALGVPTDVRNVLPLRQSASL
jgi:hypothetical protein